MRENRMETNLPQLSKRLRAVADLITEGSKVADIGTDHGYVPVYLMMTGRALSCIAMDVRKGPLMHAQEHITASGLESVIQTRISDGLANLQDGDADTIICAGMGGKLMQKLLRDTDPAKKGIKEMILQPQSECREFRRFLRQSGYCFLIEDMILEEGKFYPMMKVQYQGENAQKASEVLKLSDLYGGLLLQNRHPVLKTFLEKEKLIYTGIKENLEKQPASEKIRTRLAEVEDILHYNELALQFYV